MSIKSATYVLLGDPCGRGGYPQLMHICDCERAALLVSLLDMGDGIIALITIAVLASIAFVAVMLLFALINS